MALALLCIAQNGYGAEKSFFSRWQLSNNPEDIKLAAKALCMSHLNPQLCCYCVDTLDPDACAQTDRLFHLMACWNPANPKLIIANKFSSLLNQLPKS